jgi:hypothetical protein
MNIGKDINACVYLTVVAVNLNTTAQKKSDV